MENGIMAIVGLVGGAVLGFLFANLGIKRATHGKIEEANKKADLTIKEAELTANRKISEAESKADKLFSKAESKNESIKQKKIQEAKDKYSKLKADYQSYKADQKVEMKEREMQVVSMEKDFKAKRDSLKGEIESIEQRESEVSAIKENLEKQIKIVAKKKEELDTANEARIKQLETIAKMSEADAKDKLLEAVKDKAQTEALAIEKETINEAKATAAKEAKKIIIQTIQRMGAEYTIENTVSVFNLDSDDIKGQIIGREGRNIRALEAATGAEIIVDDTPEAIIISSFDPIRREICRLSLKRLVADGRIHPAKIEETVEKVSKQLEDQIKEIGERTVIDLDIHGLKASIVRMVGRMRFRSSYGQNLLKHSIETKMAKRAGLLHDIGKVADEESELPHALLGMEMLKKVNEHPVILNAVGAHHDEIEMNNIISPLVQACDAISGARPGARREILESYLKRIGELEDLALGYEGVQKAYAIQAGRELRVIVESEKVSDQFADDLAFMISQKIETEMQYPGQVKVTVIREKRATAVAR